MYIVDVDHDTFHRGMETMIVLRRQSEDCQSARRIIRNRFILVGWFRVFPIQQTGYREPLAFDPALSVIRLSQCDSSPDLLGLINGLEDGDPAVRSRNHDPWVRWRGDGSCARIEPTGEERVEGLW